MDICVRPTGWIWLLASLAAGPLVQHGAAAVSISSFSPSDPAPLPVGTTITWAVTAGDTDPGTLVYRFAVQAPGAARGSVVRDFHPSSSFAWTPASGEGTYTVQVVVQNQATNRSAAKTVDFTVTSRVTGTIPVVSATPHPLVALYSAPPCSVGSSMVVVFKKQGSTDGAVVTNAKRCSGATSMNFYLAGLLANTTYQINHKLISSSGAAYGPTLFYTTGAIPAVIAANTPANSVVQPVDSQTSTADSVLLLDYISPGPTPGFVRMPMATDLAGNVLWYYPSLTQVSRYFLRPLPGGTMLIHLDDPTITVPSTQFQDSQILREIDLAGNTVRETNITQVARLLAAKYPAWGICAWTSPAGCNRSQTALLNFSHEAIRLPNGYTATLVLAEKLFVDGTQGGVPGIPADVLGDLVIVLDQSFQVVWAWNSYQKLDVNRAAVLGETCRATTTRCAPYLFMPNAFDWTHGNSLNYVPADGSLLLSVRNQDWVVKIDYADATGTGNLLWRLGPGGDFTMTGTSDPWPWFSHQHHAGYDVLGSNLLSLFDNGNTRVLGRSPASEDTNSRGMVLAVDEANKVVTPVLSVDLGSFSIGGGSAQRLSNGNYSFDSGGISRNGAVYSQSVEVVPGVPPSGTLNYIQQQAGAIYRSYRMPSLYSGVSK